MNNKKNNADGKSGRIAREKEFHDARFCEENRGIQGKYYAAIKDGAKKFTEKLIKISNNADVLECGSGADCMAYSIAPACKSITAIDISDVAIALGKKKAGDLGINNSKFMVMNAEKMDFSTNSFDVVFGRGFIHHLDIPRAFAEVGRVLKPNGTALFWEPLGHNKLINSYRNKTPESRTIDEHPLLKKDIEFAKMYFSNVNLRFYGLCSLLSVPFRDTRLGDIILKITSSIDKILFFLPGVKWQAWYCLLELKNPRRNDAGYLYYLPRSPATAIYCLLTSR